MRPGELVATGRTSQVFRYGSDSVVKVLRPGVPDQWAEREAALTAAVRAKDVPAAEVRGTVVIDGSPGIVFERIEGPSIWQLMLSKPKEVPALVEELAEVQRHIQCVGLPDGVPDLVGRLQSKISEASLLPNHERERARAMAQALPRGAALLHGDLHPGNVLLSGDGPVAIDWLDAAIGHPVADVIRSSLLIRPSPARPEPSHLPGATPALLELTHTTYVRCFGRSLDAAAKDLGRWEAVVAAGRMAESVTADEPMLKSLLAGDGEPAASALLMADIGAAVG